MERPITKAAAAFGLGFAGSAGVAAQHYEIQLALEPATHAINSRVAIELSDPEALSSQSFLLSRSYNVTDASAGPNASISVSDTNTPFPGLQRIEISRKPGHTGPISAVVSYAGPLFHAETPPDNEITDRRIELSADSLWYPISTDFNRRFTYRMRIANLPSGLSLVSPDRVTMTGTSALIVRRRPSQDIALSGSAPLNSRAIGDLTISAMDLRRPRTQVYLRNAPFALAFMERWFGPLPTGKAVVSIVDRKSGNGYSRPGYLVVADNGSPFAADDVWGRWGYVAHELSHSWWSSADFTGEDYWLVEGPAEYTALRFIEAQKGRGALEALIERKRLRAAKAGAILGHGRPSGDAVYGKAPLLLRDLEAQIGRSKFDPMFARLARRPALTTKDFLDELRRTAGQGVAAQFEDKLRT
jgi:hypothetical protein